MTTAGADLRRELCQPRHHALSTRHRYDFTDILATDVLLIREEAALVAALLGAEFERRKTAADARGEPEWSRVGADAIQLGSLERAIEDWLIDPTRQQF